jgi:hypothetical protein
MNPWNAVRRSRWTLPVLFTAGLAALYGGALSTGFLNDDHLFLEQARRHGLIEALRQPEGLGNFFRPLAREAWFALLTPLTGGDALGFHLAGALLFGAALLLIADLLRALLGRREDGPDPALWAGLLGFALLPFQRVNLLWVSCAQDLLALTGALGALALFRRGRTWPAVLVYAAATLSKETALPLPGALFAWVWIVEGRNPRAAFARVLPFALGALPWLVGESLLRQHSAVAARLVFDATHLGAATVHLVQALAGIEHAAGWFASWSLARPSVPALVLLGAIALLLPARATEGTRVEALAPRRVAGFALVWCALFTLPVWPVAYLWSGYYYTLAAVGGAVLLALAARRLARWGWVTLCLGLLWWHAAGIASPAFALREDPWTGTSHLTPYYLERAAGLSSELRTQLQKAMPQVPAGTRFFFATLPPWAGFQMGNGPAIRAIYRDPTLQSHFYSAFSESTAANAECRFLWWNGAAFEPLYANTRDPFFQVGTDLLLLDRPAGASWAFRRGLDAGGERLDHWYWLGWAFLWNGQREFAERAWSEWGARDDSTLRMVWLRKAKGALEDRDTLLARRQLVEAVRCGVGHPESHAMLGLLLQGVNAKYALLETKVAARLKPEDWLAQRDLVAGLVAARLDEPATRELEQLKRVLPEWERDTVATALARRLAERAAPASGVADFGPGGRR